MIFNVFHLVVVLLVCMYRLGGCCMLLAVCDAEEESDVDEATAQETYSGHSVAVSQAERTFLNSSFVCTLKKTIKHRFEISKNNFKIAD